MLRAATWLALLGYLVATPYTTAASPSSRSEPTALEYRVAWNGLPAAHATVVVTPVDGAAPHRVTVEARARTNSVVDVFWKFRGSVRATLRADDLTPLQFAYERRMAGTHYRTSIDFQGTNPPRSVYVKGSRRRELIGDGSGLLDPITAVWRARASAARPGDTLRYDVWTGEARYRVLLHVGSPEVIEVPAGRFRALRVVPEVWKVGPAAERDTRLRQATIWVSDDASRTLLRIRSEVFIGAVTLDLIRMSPAA